LCWFQIWDFSSCVHGFDLGPIFVLGGFPFRRVHLLAFTRELRPSPGSGSAFRFCFPSAAPPCARVPELLATRRFFFFSCDEFCAAGRAGFISLGLGFRAPLRRRRPVPIFAWLRSGSSSRSQRATVDGLLLSPEAPPLVPILFSRNSRHGCFSLHALGFDAAGQTRLFFWFSLLFSPQVRCPTTRFCAAVVS
jgi:hypothetical protein